MRKRTPQEIAAERIQLEQRLALAGTQSERARLSKRLWKLRNIEKHRMQSSLAANRWRVRNPGHWQVYSDSHPDKVAANRRRQQDRRKTESHERWLAYRRDWRERNRAHVQQRDRAYYHRVRKLRRR